MTSNGDLTQIIFEAFNKRDLSELQHYLADDAVFDFPGTELLQGRKKILLFFKILFRKFPRLEFHIEEVIVDGDHACAVWSNEGENKEGHPYHNHGVTLVRMSEGKIVFMSDYFKDTSFTQSA